MKIKQIAMACLASCTALIISATVALAQLFVVNTNELNVRRGPGTNYPITFVLRRGDRVEVIRRQGSWSFIVGERGGEGWVFSSYLTPTSSQPAPRPPSGSTNEVFRGRGSIDNARFRGSGDAQLVITRSNGNASFSLTSGRFSLEYIGVVRSNFEGMVQVRVTQFRSSEMGFRTVSASGNCDIQTSGGTSIVRSFCTVNGSGIDHGRSNFTAR